MSSIFDAAMAKLNGEEPPEGAASAGEATPDEPIGTDDGAAPDALEPDVVGADEAPADAAPSDEPTEEETAAAADAAAEALGPDATDEERQEARDEVYARTPFRTYASREEVEADLEAKERLIGKHGTRLDEMQRKLDDLEQQRQEEAAQPQQLNLPEWEQWAQEQVAGGAGEAGAMAALEEGGYEGLQVYLRHWLTVAESETMTEQQAAQQRAQAVLFNNEIIMQIAETRAAAAAEAKRQEPTAQDLSVQAHEIVKAKYADLDEYADAMAEVVTNMSDEDAAFLRDIGQDGVRGRAKVLELVYREAKQSGATRKQKAQKVADARVDASAEAATLAATTSTTEGIAARTPPPAAEQVGLDRKRGLRERQGLEPLE